MNDFLNRLAAQRRDAQSRGDWDAWRAAHVSEGQRLFEIVDPAAREAVSSFLAMVPSDRYKTALVLAGPEAPYEVGRMDPGLAGTGMRILVPDRATVEALAAWRRDAFEVGYLHVERTYTDDGFPARDVYIILQDGRINRQPGPYLYEAMAKFVVDNGL